MTFPDVEAALMDWLKATFPDLADGGIIDQHVGNDVPADVQARLPFVTVERVDGDDDFFTDYPEVDVEVFDSSRNGAYHLSEAIRQRLRDPLLNLAGVRVDRVLTSTGPRRLPWDADGTHRRGATYRLSIRR